MITQAFLDFQASQQRITTKALEKLVDCLPPPCHKEVDALRAEQNGAFESQLLAA